MSSMVCSQHLAKGHFDMFGRAGIESLGWERMTPLSHATPISTVSTNTLEFYVRQFCQYSQ